jgi:ABC-2 type transport system permease protein
MSGGAHLPPDSPQAMADTSGGASNGVPSRMPSHTPSSLQLSLQRIGALLLRHWYLISKSPIRIGELTYWPTMQMIMWGFLAKHMASGQMSGSPLAATAGLLVAGVLLWDTLFRSQVGTALTFLEEMYSRNLGHLFGSPLRSWELIASLVIMGGLRTLFGVGIAAVLAVALHGYSIFALGLPLLAFVGNLMVLGFCFGIMASALVLRYGLAAENFAWGFVFAIAPLSGIYYPISVLPSWLQPIAYALPTAHVFEGMRSVGVQGVFRWDSFFWAVGLNCICLALAVGVLLWAFRSARQLGLLLQTGE